MQLTSLVLDCSKRVEEKQKIINGLETKLIASNQQIEKLSRYINHWRGVEEGHQYQRQKREQREGYIRSEPTPPRSLRGGQKRQQQPPFLSFFFLFFAIYLTLTRNIITTVAHYKFRNKYIKLIKVNHNKNKNVYLE